MQKYSDSGENSSQIGTLSSVIFPKLVSDICPGVRFPKRRVDQMSVASVRDMPLFCKFPLYIFSSLSLFYPARSLLYFSLFYSPIYNPLLALPPHYFFFLIISFSSLINFLYPSSYSLGPLNIWRLRKAQVCYSLSFSSFFTYMPPSAIFFLVREWAHKPPSPGPLLLWSYLSPGINLLPIIIKISHSASAR